MHSSKCATVSLLRQISRERSSLEVRLSAPWRGGGIYLDRVLGGRLELSHRLTGETETCRNKEGKMQNIAAIRLD